MGSLNHYQGELCRGYWGCIPPPPKKNLYKIKPPPPPEGSANYLNALEFPTSQSPNRKPGTPDSSEPNDGEKTQKATATPPPPPPRAAPQKARNQPNCTCLCGFYFGLPGVPIWAYRSTRNAETATAYLIQLEFSGLVNPEP